MTKKKIKENPSGTARRISVDDIVLVCAFRYALGRRSYITGWISDEIIRCWDELSIKFQMIIQKEIEEAIKDEYAGEHIDVLSWKRILDLKIKEEGKND